MALTLPGWLAVAVALGNTIVFFVLGKDLPAVPRLFASLHGIAALAILPVTIAVVGTFPTRGEIAGMAAMLVVGGISGTSIFYAIATVKKAWYWHLLHVSTLAVIAGGFVIALFLVPGP